MTQASDLPLHDVIAKNRVINSGCNLMLTICAYTVRVVSYSKIIIIMIIKDKKWVGWVGGWVGISP